MASPPPHPPRTVRPTVVIRRWLPILLAAVAAGCSPILTPIPPTPTFQPRPTPSHSVFAPRASTLPSQPTQVSTTTAIPTPIVRAPTVGSWAVPTIELALPSPFTGADWNGSQTVRIRPSSGSQVPGTLSLNVSDQKVVYHPSDLTSSNPSGSIELASPGGAYRLVLGGRQATVFRFFDGGVLARAEADIVIPTGLPSRPSSVAWSPDGSSLALLTTSGDVVVISLQNGRMTTIKSVGAVSLPPIDATHWALAWSPGSTKLAIMSLSDQGTCTARVEIVSSTGRILPSSTLNLDCESGEFPGWATDEVLQVTEASSQSFYRLPSGQLLVTRHLDPSAGEQHSAVSISPGQRWMAMDDEVQAPSGGGAGQTSSHKAYSIVDFTSGDVYRLSDTPGDDIEWVTWKLDASVLYLVSRPASDGALADPRTPFGLLAYDPEHNTMRRELDRAVQASFDPTQTWAFVVLSDPKTGGLASALWLPAQNRLGPARMLSTQPAYAVFPDGISGHGQVITPAAWSHDGRQVAYADGHGALQVTSLAGPTRTIATSLFSDWKDWNSRANLAWSPDDQHLLISYGGRIWVADLSSGS